MFDRRCVKKQQVIRRQTGNPVEKLEQRSAFADVMTLIMRTARTFALQLYIVSLKLGMLETRACLSLRMNSSSPIHECIMTMSLHYGANTFLQGFLNVDVCSEPYGSTVSEVPVSCPAQKAFKS